MKRGSVTYCGFDRNIQVIGKTVYISEMASLRLCQTGHLDNHRSFLRGVNKLTRIVKGCTKVYSGELSGWKMNTREDAYWLHDHLVWLMNFQFCM